MLYSSLRRLLLGWCSAGNLDDAAGDALLFAAWAGNFHGGRGEYVSNPAFILVVHLAEDLIHICGGSCAEGLEQALEFLGHIFVLEATLELVHGQLEVKLIVRSTELVRQF